MYVIKFFLLLPAAILYSLCLFGMYMAGCNRILSAIFSILSMGAATMASPGQMPIIQDMSPTFSGEKILFQILFLGQVYFYDKSSSLRTLSVWMSFLSYTYLIDTYWYTYLIDSLRQHQTLYNENL